MATEIREEQAEGGGSRRKPVLVGKIEGFPDVVNMALVIPKEDGVISVSDDKSLRVWLKRDTGQYWPSICHTMPAEASALDYNSETRLLFVAQDSGTISEFELTDDYNRLLHRRDYIGGLL